MESIGRLEWLMRIIARRCNNVLWISGDSTVKAENGDTEMRG